METKPYASDLASFAQWSGYHQVYLIGPKDADRPVKIGNSDNHMNRLTQLQGGSWRELCCHGFWWLPTRGLAGDVERTAHSVLASHRLKGEWFDVPVEVAADTVRGLIKASGADSPSTAVLEEHKAEYYAEIVRPLVAEKAKLREKYARPKMKDDGDLAILDMHLFRAALSWRCEKGY